MKTVVVAEKVCACTLICVQTSTPTLYPDKLECAEALHKGWVSLYDISYIHRDKSMM